MAYLLNGATVNEAVFTRTLLALGEDGWLRIEPEDAGMPVVRINRLPAPGQVRPFEQAALDRVVQRMGTATYVPLSALTSNEGDDHEPWWARFRDAVATQAREAGLVSRGSPNAFACVVPLGLAIAAGIATAIAARSIGGGFGVAIAVIVVCLIIVGAVTSRVKLTAQGIAAAEWWRQHGGGFDGAVIADQVPAGAQPSPYSPESLAAHGSAPLPDGYVWSSYGGRWRTVKVGSLSSPSWGRPGVAVLCAVFGLFFTIPATVAGHVLFHGGIATLISIVPLAVSGAIIFLSWLPANRRRAGIPTRAAFTGQIVKRWTYEDGGEDGTTHYCCCVDDGVSPEGWSFRVELSVYNRIHVGDMVSVVVNPRWHKLERLQPATAAPGPRT